MERIQKYYQFSIHLLKIELCQILLMILVISLTPPSEATLLRNETREVDSKTMAYWAHNFAKESSKEEDNIKSIFCKAANLDLPPPAFLHNYSSVHDKLYSPFKLIISKTKATKGQLGSTDSDIMALFYNYHNWLGTGGCCMIHPGSKGSCVIACCILKAMMILLRLLLHMCFLGQKTYEEWQVLFISWRSLLNAIKAGDMKLGSRQKKISCRHNKYY